MSQCCPISSIPARPAWSSTVGVREIELAVSSTSFPSSLGILAWSLRLLLSSPPSFLLQQPPKTGAHKVNRVPELRLLPGPTPSFREQRRTRAEEGRDNGEHHLQHSKSSTSPHVSLRLLVAAHEHTLTFPVVSSLPPGQILFPSLVLSISIQRPDSIKLLQSLLRVRSQSLPIRRHADDRSSGNRAGARQQAAHSRLRSSQGIGGCRRRRRDRGAQGDPGDAGHATG